jgi:glucose-1-phosphate adenylyltransferase
MNNAVIHEKCQLNKSIVAENTVIGAGCVLGAFEEAENETDPHIYTHGLVTVGEDSVVPENIRVGKNCVISGETEASDYEDGILASGKSLIKNGEQV